MMLRDGRFDAILAGRRWAAWTLLTEPPNVERIKKLAGKKEQGAAGQAAVPEARSRRAEAPPPPPPSAFRGPATHAAGRRQYFRLHVLRSLWGGPDRYDPRAPQPTIGRAGDDRARRRGLLPPERGRRCPVEEETTLARGLSTAATGCSFASALRSSSSTATSSWWATSCSASTRTRCADDGPDPDPTYFYSSPKWPSSFRIVQVFEGGGAGCVRGRSRQHPPESGRRSAILVFPDDPLVSRAALPRGRAGRQRVPHRLVVAHRRVRAHPRRAGNLQGDELLVGRTRLVVDLSPASA